MNLVLIGYRGTGKSTVAALLAARLGRTVESTDAHVITLADCFIPDIVASRGWEYFRSLETTACLRFAKQDRLIIDTGGGIILQPENIVALKSTGLVFWLTATVETITARIADDTQRPSLTADKTFVEEIRDVLTTRTPLYRTAADYTVATDNRSAEDVADEIVALFAKDKGRDA